VDAWTRRLTATVAVALVAVLASMALARVLSDDAPEARHVAAWGDDRATCTAAAPCRSFQRALDVAPEGSEILVSGGRYGAQRLRPTPERKGSEPVVIRPAGQAPVEVAGELVVTGRDVEVRDITVAGWTVGAGASHVTMRRVRSTAGMFITSADHVRVLGGSVGPGTDYSPEIKAAEGSPIAPHDILIDGVTFHDWTRDDRSSHVDCLHVMAVDGLVVRRSRFRNCEAFALLFTSFGEAGTPRHVVVEDNDLGCCRSGFYSLQLGATSDAPYRDILVRNNRVPSGISVEDGGTAPGAGVRLMGNVGPPINPAACGLPGVEWDRCPG
jgi:hypothetical protein